MRYVAYASLTGRYWEHCAQFSPVEDFRRLLSRLRCATDPTALHHYRCWHIVRVQDGVVIAQSKNAKV